MGGGALLDPVLHVVLHFLHPFLPIHSSKPDGTDDIVALKELEIIESEGEGDGEG